ncbi:MAG: helix-turn-helix transcriptional regulator [Clostridia bacterium]|nr:helix-turn-helix transcriptional regulator [Clostridia bacterium]
MSNIGNKETFAKNLTYYINRSHRSQKEIAEIVGVSPSTFNEWVKGKKYPRMDKVEMLADYFGILKSDLIEEKGENKNPPVTKLTEGEELLLELYRTIPDDKKQLAIEMLKVALQIK